MKVDPKALGLVPLTDSEWAGLPSTRANYVHFSQQLPNPLLEGHVSLRNRPRLQVDGLARAGRRRRKAAAPRWT